MSYLYEHNILYLYLITLINSLLPGFWLKEAISIFFGVDWIIPPGLGKLPLYPDNVDAMKNTPINEKIEDNVQI